MIIMSMSLNWFVFYLKGVFIARWVTQRAISMEDTFRSVNL